MPPRIEIIGDAEKAAPFIIWAKREWYLREGRWVKHTGTCLIELFRAGDTGLIRIIPETVGGFVGHPRTGPLKQLPFWNNIMDQKYLTGIDGGGYFEKEGAWEEIANRTPYPLEDSDLGTFLLGKEVEWLGDTDNYGNCWWTDGDSTLSWKANPNWQFPLDSSFNIPGLSRPENKVGDKQYFTCFSNNIYEGGAVLTVGPVTPPAFGSNVIEPSLIAGAWYLGGSLLCCSVVNKADTIGGYWLGIYKQDGEEWKLIGTEFSTSRLHTPAFISKDGKTIVQGPYKYTLNDDLTEVIQTSMLTVENTGTRIITGAGGYGSTYKYTSSAEYWSGINKENLPEISLVSSKADFGYRSVGNTSVQTKMVPVYRGNPATEASIGKLRDDLYEVLTNGSYCSIRATSTGDIHIKDVSGTWIFLEDPITCGTLTATLEPMGISKTITIFNPVFVSQEETTCEYDPVGVGYILSPTGYLRVTWALSPIPVETLTTTIADILASCATYTKSCSGCFNSVPYEAYSYPDTTVFANKYLNYGGRLRHIFGYSSVESFCTGNETNHSRGTVFDSVSSLRLVYSTSLDIYCVACGYCTKTFDSINLSLSETPYCSSWLSDSYLTDLTDINGTPIEVPPDNGTYLYKVAKVEVFECP